MSTSQTGDEVFGLDSTVETCYWEVAGLRHHGWFEGSQLAEEA